LKRLKKQQEEAAKPAKDDVFDEFLDNTPAPEPEKKLSKSQLKRLKKQQEAAIPAEDDVFDEFNTESAPATETLSKAQLKRLKKKQQQEAEAKDEKEAEPAPEEKKEVDTSKMSKAQLKKYKKRMKEEEKKKKKGPSALALKIQAQKEEEERLRKLQEEFERKQKEEEERLAAEEKEREENRLKRQEEKRLRREQLRREGKLLSKTQREKQAKGQAYLEMMRAQGLLPQAKAGDEGGKKSSHNKNKKGKGKSKDKRGSGRGSANNREPVAKTTVVVAEPEPVIEDLPVWDEPSSSDEEVMPPNWEEHVQLSEDSDDVPDTWDIDSEEEAEQEAEQEAKRQEKIAAKKKQIEEKHKRKVERRKKRAAAIKEREELILERKAAALKAKKEKAERDIQNQQDAEEIMYAEAMQAGSSSKEVRNGDLRSPICCILGHVDTGKTKLLDKIRSTDVQDKEAGGITQQIGATYFPMSAIKEQTSALNAKSKKPIDYRLPGLLIIDTPGHESFTNLRSRGTSLCDIAILVVDIMHGLEPQTLESIQLLRQRKTPFIVALNKCDRMYNWKATPNNDFRSSLEQQHFDTKNEFEKRVGETVTLFAEQGLNCCLYYDNKDTRSTISLVPTSAITGEGIPDMLMLLVQLTQGRMSQKLAYVSELQCTVLEVKMIEGRGTTIDVVLVNGYLNEGDTIVVCGMNGPIVTTIRALLTPKPMSEIRVKGSYIQHKRVKAAMGVKILANGLEHTIAGSQLLSYNPARDDLEDLKDEVMADLATILSKVDKSGKGVYVQASTLGSLEALLQFLQDSKIPVSGIAIGDVHKKDVMKAAVMLEHRIEFATILAFDVNLSKDAKLLADSMGVKIFQADIIYHLFDMCTGYMDEITKKRRESAESDAVFPCVLTILSEHIYRIKNPILIGVEVKEGILKIGTPLCIPTKQNMMVGRVIGLQHESKDVKVAKKGMQVACKIDTLEFAPNIMYGRQFDFHDELVSLLSRRSIDLLKLNFKDDLEDEEWRLVIRLKRVFEIL